MSLPTKYYYMDQLQNGHFSTNDGKYYGHMSPNKPYYGHMPCGRPRFDQ
jgi:hypothetical protein